MKRTTLIFATLLTASTATAGCPPSQINCTPRLPIKDTTAPALPAISGDAVAASLGALDLAPTSTGQTAWAIGVAGVQMGDDSAAALAAGLRYGISDHVSLSVKFSANANARAAFVGIGGKF